jgi:hypothetical protein
VAATFKPKPGQRAKRRDSPPQSTQPLETKWWFELDKDSEKLSAGLFTYVQEVQRRSNSRHLQMLENLRLYGQPHASPYIGGESMSRTIEVNTYGNASRVTISLVQACLDTLKSKLSKTQPRPMFVTEDGDYGQQHVAKGLQSFIDGVFYDTQTYQLTPLAFVDSGIFGDGFLHAYEDDNGRIAAERVFAYELLVDDADGLYGYPQNSYRVKYISKVKLKAKYPQHVEKIDTAYGLKSQDQTITSRNTHVMVMEAWHLKSMPDGDDGRHTMALSNVVLLDEEWKRDDFPFRRMPYCPKQCGYYSQGLAEPLAPLQTELNTLLKKIQVCMHFLAVPHWLKPAWSNIGFGAFNNQIGSVINYTGLKPELAIWNSVPPELFRHVDWLYGKAFEISGVSQLSAQSKIPGYGTMSGAALREYNDVETDRFYALGMSWQQFHIDIADLFVKTAQEIAERNDGKYEIMVVRNNVRGRPQRLEKINWKDIKLGDGRYQIRCLPTSKFSREVPGAMQTAQDLVQSGQMPAEEFRDFMGMPDLPAELNVEGAGRELIHKLVFNILDHGEYQAPDAYMDLSYAMRYSVLMLNRAMSDGASDDRIEMLRSWISEADDIQAGAMQAAQTPNPGATSAPPPQALAPTGTSPAGAQ